MGFDDLTAEQRKRAMSARTPEEILELAREAGYELSEAELAGIAGGDMDWCDLCLEHTCDRLQI